MNSEEQLVSTFQDDQNYISPPSPKPLKRRKKVAAGFYEWRKSKETGDGNEIQNPEEEIYNIPDYFSPSIRHCSPESQKRIVKNALMNNPKLAARFDKWMKERNEKRAIEAAAQNALKHPQRTIEVDQKIIQYEQCLQNPEFKTNLQKAMQKIILLLHAENCFQHVRISHTHQYYYECPFQKLCQDAKDLLIHINSCQSHFSGVQCLFPECDLSKQSLSHWRACPSRKECPWCAPAFHAGMNYSILFI